MKGAVTVDHWKKLNLSAAAERPAAGALTALRLIPKTGWTARHCPEERYDIGVFRLPASGGKKLWWHGTKGCEDLQNMKKRNEIWWCPVAEFDGRDGL